MRPQFARATQRLIVSLGPVLPILLVVISGKRW
jgi:hypothetical protein